MRLVDKDALAQARSRPRCENCRKSVAGCEPAHIFSRGAGQVDAAANLIGLCTRCHHDSHACQKPNRATLLTIAARRERTTVTAIEGMVMFIRRVPRGSSEATIHRLMVELDGATFALTTHVLQQAGVIHADYFHGPGQEAGDCSDALEF